MSFSLRLKDLRGPETRVKKKKSMSSDCLYGPAEPTSLGQPWGPRNSPAARSEGGAVSYERGTHVSLWTGSHGVEIVSWVLAGGGVPLPSDYRGTSLIRKSADLGSYSRTVPRAL